MLVCLNLIFLTIFFLFPSSIQASIPCIPEFLPSIHDALPREADVLELVIRCLELRLEEKGLIDEDRSLNWGAGGQSSIHTLRCCVRCIIISHNPEVTGEPSQTSNSPHHSVQAQEAKEKEECLVREV